MKTPTLVVLAGFLAVRAGAQSILFDFDNASVHTALPIDLTVGGITAHFSATGPGYSIQPVGTLGLAPTGFSGYCLYPDGIGAADLLVGFSTPLTDFSILYAAHDLACDAAATLSVTAYLNDTFAAAAATNATWNCTCTWTSQILSISSAHPFNRVVVHYVAPGPGCQDYGPNILADNMIVTPMPPIILTAPTNLANGAFQFTFTNTPNAPFTVLGTTNPALPFSNWTTLPGLIEAPPGQFLFIDPQAANVPQRFYRVTSP